MSPAATTDRVSTESRETLKRKGPEFRTAGGPSTCPQASPCANPVQIQRPCVMREWQLRARRAVHRAKADKPQSAVSGHLPPGSSARVALLGERPRLCCFERMLT